MKVSNDDDYGVTPIHGFIDPSESTNVDVTRMNGIPENDRLVHEVPTESFPRINLCAQ
ncbi:unnamed protein product [Nippostrongylus brasiliensis]|uniref:MSP domain-containing protein n=1 Tax=Nippostrongylus brasiliensis TaxID=27835 RepID=A0A0N4Y3L7_NIPBR|nr:unnamed protein product [Nippostrongylus brasiliensis]